MSSELMQVDAFTDRAFGGNPAAVCLLNTPAETGWMQDVAAEMNLSETAFLVRRTDGFDLRWFTPVVEVALCGHATLASAHALWTSGQVAENSAIRFFTASGELRATRENGLIWLDLPERQWSAANLQQPVRAALGATPVWEGVAGMDLLVELESEDAIRALSPDLGALRNLAPEGLIVTSKASMAGYDFVSRYFAPNAGIDEDPVTGSAHCALAPYWSARLRKSSFRAFQASRRGGDLHLRMGNGRIFVGGSAVMVLRGKLA